MATYVPPKKNTEFIFYASLVDQADTKLFKANPTIAAGDFQVSTDGGALSNLDTLPTVTPAAGRMVKFTLSATEMNGDNVTVVCSDAAGSEWCDLTINLQTAARQIDDLAYPTTSGRSVDVTATGAVGIDWANVENQSTAVDLSATDIQLADTTTTVTNQVTADVTAISGDSTAADNLEAAVDGTGYGFTNCTMPTVTTLTDHTPQTGDTYALANGAAGFVAIDTVVDAILVDTGTTIPATLATIETDTTTDIPALIATAQADLDILTGADGVNLLSATQASIDAIEADTGELQTDWANDGRLDLILDTAASGGDATEAKQDTIIAAVGTMTDLGGGADIANNLADIAGATFNTSTDSAEAIRNRGDAAWITGAGTGLTALASGTAQSGTASTIVLADASTFADDELNGNVINIHTGTGAGQSRVIYDYDGDTDTASVSPNWTTNPSSDSEYEVVAYLGTPVSTQTGVSETRTWRLQASEDGNFAPNIMGCDVGEIYTLAMDFASVLNDGAGISSISSVSISGTSLITTSGNAISQDKQRALVDYNCASATIGEYRVTIKIVTTDGDTVMGWAWLHVI